MQVRRIAGTSPYEPIVGFCRAVVAGDRVYVAGTAPIPPEGGPPPESVLEQTRLCLRLIGTALEQAGTGFAHVVRTRVFLTDPSSFEEYAIAHGEVFSDVRPANTTVVCALLDPAWKVEIEAEAILP